MRLSRVLVVASPALALAWTAACSRETKSGERQAANADTAQTRQVPATVKTGPGTAPPSIRYNQHIFAGGIAPPGDTMHNPLAGDARAAKVGGQLFASMNCDGCHGGGATGWVGPSLSDGRWRYGGDDGEIFHSIYYGRPRGMPAFGGVLPPDYIWQIVTYLRSLPVPKDLPTESWQSGG